jgi:hypothetical protein
MVGKITNKKYAGTLLKPVKGGTQFLEKVLFSTDGVQHDVHMHQVKEGENFSSTLPDLMKHNISMFLWNTDLSVIMAAKEEERVVQEESGMYKDVEKFAAEYMKSNGKVVQTSVLLSGIDGYTCTMEDKHCEIDSSGYVPLQPDVDDDDMDDVQTCNGKDTDWQKQWTIPSPQKVLQTVERCRRKFGLETRILPFSTLATIKYAVPRISTLWSKLTSSIVQDRLEWVKNVNTEFPLVWAVDKAKELQSAVARNAVIRTCRTACTPKDLAEKIVARFQNINKADMAEVFAVLLEPSGPKVEGEEEMEAVDFRIDDDDDMPPAPTRKPNNSLPPKKEAVLRANALMHLAHLHNGAVDKLREAALSAMKATEVCADRDRMGAIIICMGPEMEDTIKEYYQMGHVRPMHLLLDSDKMQSCPILQFESFILGSSGFVLDKKPNVDFIRGMRLIMWGDESEQNLQDLLADLKDYNHGCQTVEQKRSPFAMVPKSSVYSDMMNRCGQALASAKRRRLA